MAFTEPEAKVLGALSNQVPPHALTVRQLCRATRLPETSVHRALLRLSRTGLATGTLHGPAQWRCTHRGRLAITRPSTVTTQGHDHDQLRDRISATGRVGGGVDGRRGADPCDCC
ncbi:helix-turn-helix domain-containing protein [Nocardia sp. NPDC051030]|uniref:MarR family transcriptional regulator n=1 Tax=Nocardia sp. NPDC051030 TaxID=3155162 RepID=UPI0034342551